MMVAILMLSLVLEKCKAKKYLFYLESNSWPRRASSCCCCCVFELVFEASFGLSELLLVKIVIITFDYCDKMQLLLLKFYRILAIFQDFLKILTVLLFSWVSLCIHIW